MEELNEARFQTLMKTDGRPLLASRPELAPTQEIAAEIRQTQASIVELPSRFTMG